MTKRTLIIISLLAAYAAFVSCVDHRPLRTEVFSEEIYLPKDFLTRENPNRKDTKLADNTWLYKVTVLKASAPDWGLLFPGENSSPRYVRFQFKPKDMEMVDGTEYSLNQDKDGNFVPSDALTPAVLNAWPGQHVDIKMKDNMDGERTNVIEENKEAPWQQRQYFKVDFEQAAVKDVNMLFWAKTDYDIGECATLRSVSVVPNSYKIEKNATKTGADKGDDYFEWTVSLTYEARVFGGGYYCGDMMTGLMDRTTFTYEMKYSFWRPPNNSDFTTKHAIEYKEKEPTRKLLGGFETAWGRMTVFHDKQTDVAGGRSFLMRFDPTKTHTFYFTEAWPEKYKDHFKTDVAKQVNALMKKVGRTMTIEFKDHDWECAATTDKTCDPTTRTCKGTSTPCVVRTFGDIRYSMLAYHDVPSSSGLIGMAYFNFDPRNGEIFSGGFNMYDWSDQYYAYLLQDYIKEVTGDTFEDKKTACKPGDTIKIDPTLLAQKFKYTSIYNKLESYMGQKAEKWVTTRTDDYGKYQRMLMPELVFAVPGWNSYVNRGASLAQLDKMTETDVEFRQHLDAVDRGKSPFEGHSTHSSAGIAKGLDKINTFKAGVRNHRQLKIHRDLLRAYRMACNISGWELGPAMARSARVCKKDGKWETRTEWAQRIVDTYFKVFATHEFGHTLSLRHNFYGSVDKPHFGNGGKDVTSSIMEYSYTLAEGAETPEYKPHDVIALEWIYGSTPKDLTKYAPDPKENWLYCTDEHRYFSPFCRAHDMGTTPTEMVKNEIDKYEWLYKFRNFRAYRKFWSTRGYASAMLNMLYDLRRFLNVWALDLYPEDIKNDLTLLGIKGDETFFANITDEFIDEFGQANRMVANFYKAVLQQSAAERSYATKFDNFYGDVTQQGIILDKYYSMFFFLGLWPVDEYDQNLYAYLAYYEGSRNNPLYYSNCQDVTDAMLGGQYDVYPWFKPTAILLFAQDTSDVMFGDKSKQKWIELRKFERKQDMTEFFDGLDPTVEALKYGNTYQTFKDKAGDDWVYYYMVDRQLHLVANKNKNPTAYMKLWDHNESINLNKSTSLDDYTLKYFLDYYHYFN